MADEQKPENTNEIKKVDTPEDLEMGGDEEANQTPKDTSDVKINNYLKDIPEKDIQPERQMPPVNPTAPAPQKPEGKTIGQAKTGVVQQQAAQTPPNQPTPQTNQPNQAAKPVSPVPGKTTPGKKPPNPAARKKAVLGCLGLFGGIVIIFLIMAFIFIAQSDGQTESPIAKLFGLNQASFVNGLITLVHIVFIFTALVVFVFTMIGLFKAVMAKKGDRETKKQGLKQTLIAGSILIFMLISWFFVYIYLDAKRVQITPVSLEAIITDPEETINLSAPVEIKFDATNAPVDKNNFQIIYYEWDFGDGSDGTGMITSHEYEEKGKYDVVLTITRRDKKTNEEFQDKHSVIVSVSNQKLSAIINAEPISGEAPLEVTFDASESIDPDGNIDRYEWDFDEDGIYDEEGETATYTFDKIGKYTVSLRVVSTTEEFDISEQEIVVEEASEPEAIITVVDEPAEYLQNVSYVFSAEESSSPNGKIESYEWDFGDGSTESTKTVSRAFPNEGTYVITLKVIDEDEKEGETTFSVNVGVPQSTPKVIIKTDPLIPGDGLSLEGAVPFTVAFDGSGSTDADNNIVDYGWDFDGDGTDDAFGASSSYTFKEEGDYSVKLNVTDADGNVGSASVLVKVTAKAIEAVLNADKVEGNVPLTVSFDASGSTYDNGQITSYKWDFGDGTAPKLGSAEINHKYTEVGTYTASVEVIGADNTTNTATLLITVRDIPLEACFVSVFEDGPAPLETSFDPGCTTGTVSSYFWDFGDGSTSTDVKPTHTFSDPGQYTVTLEVSDSENTVSTADLTINVTEEIDGN